MTKHVNRRPINKKTCTCEWCHNEFETWPSRPGRFCSNQCRSEFAARQPKIKARVDVKSTGSVVWYCKQCGKEMCTFKSRIKDTCSTKCAYLYWPKRIKKSVNCQTCGKEFFISKFQVSTINRKFCSHKCKAIAQVGRFSGDKNPNWKNGSSLLKGRGENWKSQSKKARVRDNYTCQNCGSLGISVHHIKPYRLFNGDWKSANVLSNLITLCMSCHMKIEHNIIPCPHPKLESPDCAA